MGKRVASWLMVALFTLTVAFAGCGKKEEPAPPPAPAAPAGGAPGDTGAMAPAPGGGEPAPGAPMAPAPTEKKAEGAKAK